MRQFNIVLIVAFIFSVSSGHADRSKHSRMAVQQTLRELQLLGEVKENASGCSCLGYQCGCCIHAEVEVIDLNDTLCVNLTYLPAPEYGISFTVDLDDKTIFNETISARNPPPICFDVPYLKKLASLCVHFYNLSLSDTSLSGCVKIEARLEYIFVKDFDLGCFKIPPGLKSPGNLYFIKKKSHKRGQLNRFEKMKPVKYI
ncbi:hypothetical protein ACJMK2_014364 [Sinanodonta woodiana]|uniref:DUF4773 domain-containing protein n=1 Tax=Sinanodonta woodiana TaxID=1069815 RepID=A0ABD3V3C4_SINWO